MAFSRTFVDWSASDETQERARTCYDELNGIVDDDAAPDDDIREAADLMRYLEPYLVLSRSTHYPEEALQASQAARKGKCLVFEKSRKELLKTLGEDRMLDERYLTDIGKLSEKGAFGIVYKGTYLGVPVAIKELREECEKTEGKSFRIEGKQMMLLRHPFICECIGYLEKPFRIVTIRYSRDLTTALQQRDAHGKPVLTKEDKFRIAYQLAAALLFLHKNNILHRDVKTDNIFLDENNNVKLADFGLSMYVEGVVYDAGSAPGSPLYMAPEVLEKKDFDVKCEVYTYGLMLYEIFTGRQAFEGIKTVPQLVAQQKEAEPLPVTKADWSHDDNDGLPPKELWTLAKQCWKYSPEERPTMEEVVNEIVRIGVQASIPHSKTAVNFWLSCSSFVFRDHLLLPELVGRCVKVPGIDMEELIKAAVPPTWKPIAISEFWLLCCWFPNFFVSRSSQRDMMRIVHSDWYVADEDEVRARLGDPKSRNFVIRPSSSDSMNKPFTLCVNMEGKVSYHRISHRYDEVEKCGFFTCESFILAKRFSSVFDIGECAKNDFGLSPATVHLDKAYAPVPLPHM